MGGGCWTGCGPAVTRARTSGRWGSTPPSCEPTSTPPAPAMPRPPPGWPVCWRVWPDPGVTQGALPNHKNRPPEPTGGDRGDGRLPPRRDREAIGRSRGGLTTKIHLLADLRSRPLARVTTAGQRGDSLVCAPLMGRLRIARAGPGRPRTRPGRLLGDKAYSSRAIRVALSRRKVRAVIAEPADQTASRRRRGSTGGRPPASTRSPTDSATPPSGASTRSRVTGPWRCAPTSAPTSTTAPSTSPRSESGPVTSPSSHQTRPRACLTDGGG